jgi:hypothetical protein
MSYNIEVPQVPEYGLNVPDESLSTKAVCEGCEGPFGIWPGKDWLYCQKCNLGISRTAACTPQWVLDLSPADRRLLTDYETKVIGPRASAEKLWKYLTVNLNNSGPLLALKTCGYLKTVETEEQLVQLKQLVGDMDWTVPFSLFRLEDLPGRLTGFVAYKRTNNQYYSYKVLPVVDGARLAFLSSAEDTTILAGHIIVPSFLDAMFMKSAATNKSNKALPIVYSDLSATQWEPHARTSSVLLTNDVTTELIRALLRSSSHTRLALPDKTARWTPVSSAAWYDKVYHSSAIWRVALAEEFQKMGATQAVAFVHKARLEEEALQKLLEEMTPEFRQRFESLSSNIERSYKLSNKTTVFDDGFSWKDQRGEVLLSASFRVLEVTKSTNGVIYKCSLTWNDGAIQFDAGLALERNAFRILLREALIAGRSLTFNPALAKRAVEIAVGLRPVARSSNT